MHMRVSVHECNVCMHVCVCVCVRAYACMNARLATVQVTDIKSPQESG